MENVINNLNILSWSHRTERRYLTEYRCCPGYAQENGSPGCPKGMLNWYGTEELKVVYLSCSKKLNLLYDLCSGFFCPFTLMEKNGNFVSTFYFSINISLYYRKLAHICLIKSNKIGSEQIWFISTSYEGMGWITEGPWYNESFYSEVLGITNNILLPINSTLFMKILGLRYNETRF